MNEKDPEKATIGDLFRLMTEQRGEMAEMRRDMTDMRGEMTTRFDEVDKRFDEVDVKLDQAASERQAIRDVVDNDLAGQGQVMQLEGKLTDVQKTLRKHGKQIETLIKERA